TSGPVIKEVIGVRVDGMAGLPPLGAPVFVPGENNEFNTLIPSLPNSPFLSILAVGDVLAYIQNVGLGALHKQVAPAVVTWCTIPGDEVQITYLNAVTNFSQVFQACANLQEFPAFMDYPWFSIDCFERLSPPLIPSFDFPYLPAPNFKPAF